MPSLEPRYRKIMREIRERIATGVYAPGDKLPSTDELAKEYVTSAPTVRKAIGLLAEAGEIEGQAGVGVYVAQKQPESRS